MLTPWLRKSATAAILLFLGTLGGCVRAPETSLPRENASNSAAAPTSGGNSPEADVQAAELLGPFVGERALAIVSSPETVEFADLRIVAADEAQTRESREDSARIAGYPIVGALRPLDHAQADVVAKAFADSDNYDPERGPRCAIERIIGFRFLRDGDHVDIALTDPCALAMWSFKRDDTNDAWASLFHRGLTQRIIELVVNR